MRLTKHHGLGNDFLILLDADDDSPVSVEQVRQLCDRKRGIGADGLIRATRVKDSVDAVMELYNADGGRAEMSGNGIRCLAQALFSAEWANPPHVRIATDAGLKLVTRQDRTDWFAVDMGAVDIQMEQAAGEDDHLLTRSMTLSLGNPHVVFEVSSDFAFDLVDLEQLGRRFNGLGMPGANVHLIYPGPKDDHIRLKPYERGVGPTDACGTGACAAAVAARSWSLVGDDVTVDMPGGSADVHIDFTDTGPTARLTGPATYIAAVEVSA